MHASDNARHYPLPRGKFNQTSRGGGVICRSWPSTCSKALLEAFSVTRMKLLLITLSALCRGNVKNMSQRDGVTVGCALACVSMSR